MALKKFLENPALTKQLIERIPGLVGIYNIKNGTYIYVSTSVKKILGYTPKDFTSGGLDFATSLIHPKDLPGITELNQKAIKKTNSKTPTPYGNEPILTYEYRILHKNGTYRWLHTDAVVFDRNEKGQIEHVLNISIDITKRKERELADEKNQSHLAAIVASSDDAIISKNLDGYITSWNRAAQRIFGYTSKEAIGKHITMLIPPELRAEEKVIISTIKSGKHIEHYETVRMVKSGKKIFVSLSISPIKNKNGEIIGASKIARDISDRKAYEEAMRANQERLQIAVEAGKIGIWDWDIIKNKIVWTDRVYEIHGYEKGKRVGALENYSKRHHPDDAARVQQAIRDALDGKKPYEEEFRIMTPSGETRWIETKAYVIRDADGKPIRMLGATQDISERKRLEMQKTEFIGIASHELKTPVTSIKAFAQILETKFRQEGNEVSALLLTKMNAQLNKLTGLISDLLDVTKIETGKLAFNEEYFDFNEMVTEVVDMIKPTSDRHEIVTNLGPEKTVYGDRERIGQVLTNFLTNAIKYSPTSNKIIVTTQLADDSIQVSVQDFGLGIPKKSLEKVFERFYRVSEATGQTYPGMGLGLFISSEIIQRQQGKIWVTSEKGKGSIFSFSLPLKRKLKKKS